MLLQSKLNKIDSWKYINKRCFRYLAKEVKCFALFATHFHEITHLPETISEVLNCHVTALVTDENVTPLYQIREGPCDKSYGIHCAKLVEFNEELIEVISTKQSF